MGDLIKALFGGFSRFVLSWLLPSVATLGVFVIFVYPAVSSSPVLRPASQVAQGAVAKSAIFILSAIVLGTLVSLASLPVYRVLEGYLLPRPVRRWLLRRQLRNWLRLRARPARVAGDASRYALVREQFNDYPSQRELLMPTRLGNALKAAETFGLDRFWLDSQLFWYELSAVVPERARKDEEDARASVDFFISFVTHLAMLSLVSLFVATTTGSGGALAVGVISAVLIKPAYDAAVRNTTDLRYAVQALVNLGRAPLAAGLGYSLPKRLTNERRMWASWSRLVQRGEHEPLQRFDDRRLRQQPPVSS